MQLLNITKIEEGLYSVESLPCPMCASKEILQLAGAQVHAYHNNALIQEVLPEVSAETRERFISGVCPPCWDSLMFEPEKKIGE